MLVEDVEKRIWVYDLEVYKNLVTATFIDLQDKRERVFIFNHNNNPLGEFRDFILKEVSALVGYNSQSYDDTITQYILEYRGVTLPMDCYRLSQEIINNDQPTSRVQKLRWNKSFVGVDLIRVMFSSKLRKGLKQVAINLKHPRIQDLPIPFDQEIEDDQIPLILDYNRNDVIITAKLFYKVLPDLKLREGIDQLYNVEVTSESDTGIAKKILNKEYAESSGTHYRDFKDLRSPRGFVEVKDILDSRLKFKHVELDYLLQRLRKRIFYDEDINEDEDKSKFKELVKIGNLTHKVAKGGLHSQNQPMIYANKECELIDADVGSYYPTIMLNLELAPEHLDKRSFLKTLRKLVNDRLEAKAKGDMVKANSGKITVNSIYGLLKMAFFWLFDPKVLYTVTINGQLYLLELISNLESEGIEVISANTDGVTAKVYAHQKERYYQICQEWSFKYNFTLEYMKFSKMIIRDVNNYLLVTEEGKIKMKGAFVTDISLKTGFSYPVVPLAVKNYFINQVPVEYTIKNHPDIYDYCISQKSDNKFMNQFHQIVDGEYQVSDVQKTLRYFVSTDGGSLFKVDKEKPSKRISYEAGEKVTLFNDYFEGDYNVNYQYYINEANKLINCVEKDKGQLMLF